MISVSNNFSSNLNLVDFSQPSALDLDIDKVVAQYTELAHNRSQDVEVDLIEEFQANLHKLYELSSRVNFMNKEIGYVLNKRK